MRGINPLNAQLNSICHLLALLGAHPILHVSRIRVNLLTHALFKALLFMCAGGVIHSIGDSQDIRFMGSLSVYMPFTSSSLIVF
jgi:NADH:ubiquinone oxidoreductase subunit 5 (subunit L)/multisubunit Na+/H+ antiporter MnhA subunit